MRDINSNLHVARAISPVSVADNTAQVSTVFDCRDYDGVMLAIMAGSLADADATFTLLIEDSADNVSYGLLPTTTSTALKSRAASSSMTTTSRARLAIRDRSVTFAQRSPRPTMRPPR